MTQTLEKTPTMTAHDRCDRCGAQAFVEVQFGSKSLLFCGHHFNAFGGYVRFDPEDLVRDDLFTLIYKPAL